eukprot:gene23707-26827_t
MNVISSVLKVISKNSDGFEDIDQFWNATEKLTFPLESRLKASLFAAKTVTPVKQTPTKADSDVEFNYDTSSTISDDEEDDDEEEESESEDDKDDHNDEPSLAEISTKSGKGQSAPSSGIKSGRSSIQSSVYSPLNDSLGTFGSPLGTTDNSIRQSLESGVSASNISGRDSISTNGASTAPGSTRNSIDPGSSSKKSATNRSNTNNSRRSEGGMDVSALSTISARGDVNESDFYADVSGDMNETGVQSEFGFGQKPPSSASKGRRSSATEQDSLATPANVTKSVLSSPRGTDASINLLVPPSATKGGRSVERSNLRVSFSNKPELEDLSPIAGSPTGTVDTGLSKRGSASFNTSRNSSAEKSRNSTNNASMDVSRASNKSKSRNTTTSSVNSSGTSEGEEEPSLEQSAEISAEKSRNSSRRSTSTNNSQHSPDDNNDFGEDYVDDYDAPSDVENEDQDISEDPTVSRILSQTANTPTPSKSLSRSRVELDDSGLQTPYSDANTSVGGSSSRGKGRRNSDNYSMISTPGSNEFVRGYRYPEDPDASVMHRSNDESTDEEELNTTDNTTPGKNHKSKKRHTVTDGEDDELDVSNEAVSISFIDKDFLETISSGNKKYQHGREELKKHRPRAPVRRSKLYHSDEENAASEEEDSEIEDGQRCRRSKRATKGQRFAYWKGERPIYEEGTIVGIVEVDPTPQKRKRVAKVTEDGKASKRASKKARTEGSDEEEESGPSHALPAVRLPRHVKFIPRADAADSLEVWDDVMEGESTEKIFCPAESLQPATAL